MKLIFEKSVQGRACTILPKCDVRETKLNDNLKRSIPLDLPQLSETEQSGRALKMLCWVKGAHHKGSHVV